MCAPALAGQLSQHSDLVRVTLLRSFRGQDWLNWLKAAGLEHSCAVWSGFQLICPDGGSGRAGS